MRAWIGCLASYNNARLHGEWFDVSTDADENAANIARVLRTSPYPNVTKTDEDTGETYASAEEYYVADYDETPRAIIAELGEYPSADRLALAAEIMEAISDRFDDVDEAAAVLGEMLDGQKLEDIDDAHAWISDHFAGEGNTLADWCSEYLTDTDYFGDIPKERREEIERYFDFESYARDMRLSGDISEVRVGGKVLVFWNR